MIKRPPTDWVDLQNQVSEIFSQSGLVSETNKSITTARGSVNIDVCAEDNTTQPTTTYLCECKHWVKNVSKTIVHAFRTVVLDYGANWGFIISSSGFQSGAYEAAEKSPIRLLTWDEFQELFVDRWIMNYMMSRINVADPLIEYTEPFNSRILRKARKLAIDKQRRFKELREKHHILGLIAIWFIASPSHKRVSLPLRNNPINVGGYVISDDLIDTIDDLLDAVYLQDFTDIYCRYAIEAISEFDQVFGERA